MTIQRSLAVSDYRAKTSKRRKKGLGEETLVFSASVFPNRSIARERYP